MHLGKDFWFIVKLFRIIIAVLEQFSRQENGDTPEGEI